MAGVGATGIWRTGIWVEPLDTDSAFTFTGTASTAFEGDLDIVGGFVINATANIGNIGNPLYESDFETEATSNTVFIGEFVAPPFDSSFVVSANARVREVYVFDFGPPGGQVGVKTRPGSVKCIVGPGDVVTISGVAGTVVKSTTGQLVVLDSAGAVLCIVPPSGVLIL